MKNRAKCKLCGSIIESFHRNDYVSCNCGEISIDGGADYCKAMAKDWKNFLRVDDKGNEIVVKVVEKNDSQTDDVKPLYNDQKPSRDDMLKMLNEMIKNYEGLPDNAKGQPVTHYDMLSVLLLLSSILRA